VLFPQNYVAAIQNLTRRDQESYADFIARVQTNPLAANVKRADIGDNLDPRRLDKLDEVTRAQLIEKYSPALQMLAGTRIDDA
jgi:hypothetical protein